ncbi:gamma-aminobutyric acid type B receptor subunit 2-like [Ptychodera flava]|uniref:gamma-aminobutyric acid type B receptor subunit 2-like n=1 Tax=Ptychodera flava TaxID=63121 RepID=UPI00396A2228
MKMPSSDYAPTAYDAIWALALALDDTIDVLPSGITISDFNYDSVIGKHVFEAMSRTSFQGISGKVEFDGADREGQPLVVYQIQDGEYVLCGVYDRAIKAFNWVSDIIWENGQVPEDDLRTIIKVYSTSPALFHCTCVFSSLGSLLAVSFLVFNIVNRNKRHIKLSSPKLNNVILAGGIVVYLTTVLFGVNVTKENEGVCQARAWTLAVGFTLTFGAMFSKTWRVHIIFTNKTAQSKRILDRHLFGFVFVFLLVDIIILSVWTVMDQQKLAMIQLPVRLDINGADFALKAMVGKCVSEHQLIWIGILYGYKGITLFLGVFLAWETRKVQFKQLNDSKYIGSSVYIVSILAIFGIPTIMTLRPEQCDLTYGIEAFCLIFSTTVTLCLVFVPKIVTTKRSVVDSSHPTNGVHTSPTTLTAQVPFKHSCGSCQQAENELKELRTLCSRSEPADSYIEAAARTNNKLFLRTQFNIRTDQTLPDYGGVYGAAFDSVDSTD